MNLLPANIHSSPEEQRARDLFLKQEGLRIDAYAGAGKTTTLRLLASSTNGRGLYLAFNRSIAENARGKFPTQVACATSHSLAFRAIARSFGSGVEADRGSHSKHSGGSVPNARELDLLFGTDAF